MPADAAPARLGAPKSCRICGERLSPLRAMLRDICERPACTRHEAQAQRAEERERHNRALRAAVAAARPAVDAAAVPVIWLAEFEAVDAPLPDARREDMTTYLLGLAELAAGVAAAEFEPESAPTGRADIQLCSFCQGHCCHQYAATKHAFLQPAHLRRWQEQNPGSTLLDAAQAYIAHLPERHTEGSCAYHGARGCVLPRTMRSSVCNVYACVPLADAREACAEHPARTLVVVKGWREVDSAVIAEASGLAPVREARA